MVELRSGEILALAESSATDERAAAALRARQDEVAPAVSEAIDADLPLALRMVGTLSGFWQDTGRVDEGRALTERAVEAGQRVASSNRAVALAISRALLAASELAFRQGDRKRSAKRARDAIRAAMLIEDRPTAALAHVDLARVACGNGDARDAEKHANKALDLAADDPQARRGALHMLAWAAHTSGDMPLARRRFEDSLAYRRKTGSKLSVAAELANLGDMAAEEGDLPEAAQLLEEALTIGSELNSQYMIANTLPSLAVLAARAGQTEGAAILFGAGEAIATTAGLVTDPNPAVDEQREVVRSRLGPAEMARLLAHGAALPTDEAVKLATEVASRIRASKTGG